MQWLAVIDGVIYHKLRQLEVRLPVICEKRISRGDICHQPDIMLLLEDLLQQLLTIAFLEALYLTYVAVILASYAVLQDSKR